MHNTQSLVLDIGCDKPVQKVREIAMEQADRRVHDDLAIDQVGKNSWFEPVQKFVGRPELMGDRYGGGHNFPLRSLLHDALSRRAGLSSGAPPSITVGGNGNRVRIQTESAFSRRDLTYSKIAQKLLRHFGQQWLRGLSPRCCQSFEEHLIDRNESLTSWIRIGNPAKMNIVTI